MRELTLVTLRIVDEKSRLYEDELVPFYTSDDGAKHSTDYMTRISKPSEFPAVTVVHQTSEGVQYIPDGELALLSILPCNPESAIAWLINVNGDDHFFGQYIDKLETAGRKLLIVENANRQQLNDMSRILSGDGVDSVSMVQFYAVFNVSVSGGNEPDVAAELEGVLRLDKLDFAIDEAILL